MTLTQLLNAKSISEFSQMSDDEMRAYFAPVLPACRELNFQKAETKAQSTNRKIMDAAAAARLYLESKGIKHD